MKGLLVAVSQTEAGAQRRGRRPRRDELLSERFHLGVDGTVTVLTSKVEVGQGSRTQLTQAAAEELRLPADRIRLIMADSARCPDDGGTAGSRTTPSVGAGETPIIAVAPAVANAIFHAIFHATGSRRRAMPLDLACRAASVAPILRIWRAPTVCFRSLRAARSLTVS